MKKYFIIVLKSSRGKATRICIEKLKVPFKKFKPCPDLNNATQD